MKKRIFLLLGVFLLGVFSFRSMLLAQEPELYGYVRTYIGALLKDDSDFSIVQNAFDLNFEYATKMASFKVNPFVYQKPTEALEIGLREAYMDVYLSSIDIRIGKQQIIWGKTDGVFITDVVSPKNLSEFLLPDFDEIRIGVTAFRADYYLGNHTFEIVWVPLFTPTQQPEPDSIWAASPSFPVPAVVDPTEEVEGAVQNSELFAKYSFLGSVLDFELMSGYFWDDDPTLHITDRIFSGSELVSLTLTPRHHRLGLVGISLSAAPGRVVVRGEGGYYFGKFFHTNNPSDADGVAERDFLKYGSGIDFSLYTINMSIQFIQQVILDYDERFANDRFENLMTLLARKDFLHETLHTELFAYFGFNNPDALLRPKIIYDIVDDLEIEAGANIFLGDEGQFGQFDDNDMIFTRVVYSF